MRAGIVIPTCRAYRVWLYDLLSTLDTPYPTVIAQNGPVTAYDIRAVIVGLELEFSEFFVLPDTCEIIDNSIFDKLFIEHAGRGVFFHPKGYSFINKYVRHELLQCDLSGIHAVRSKRDGVRVEMRLHSEYIRRFNPLRLDPSFVDNPAREFKHGRNNMILENQYVRKYKGCWADNMIDTADTYVPSAAGATEERA